MLFLLLLQIRPTFGLLREASGGVCNVDFTLNRKKIISKEIITCELKLFKIIKVKLSYVINKKY